MLVAGFPAQMFDTNCWVVAPAAGEECVVVDPGVGVVGQLDDAPARAPAAPGRRPAHPRPPRPRLLGHAGLRRPRRPGLHPPATTATGSPTRSTPARPRADTPRSPASWTGPSPTTSCALADGTRLQLAGLDVTVDHAPGHTEGSVLFRLPADGDEPPLCLSGDVLFAGSIGRTDLPGGDGRRDGALAARPRCCRWPTRPSCCPGTADTTTIGARARDQPVPARGGPVSRPTPLSGFPEWLPRAAHRRAARASTACAARSSCTASRSLETRAVEPLEQLLRKGEIDKEVYVLRRLQADDERRPTPGSACTST